MKKFLRFSIILLSLLLSAFFCACGEEKDLENDAGGSSNSQNQGSQNQGSQSQGSEDQGSEDQGSENQGSEDQGSENQGSENQGSEDQGGDEDSGEATPQKPSEKDETVQVTIENNTSWTPTGNVQLWALDGSLVEQRAIQNGAAQFEAKGGRYIVQLDSAPETVAFDLAVTNGERDIKITLNDAEVNELYGPIYGCAAVVLKGGEYYSDCLVGNCIMPEDGSLGSCFNPVEVTSNHANLYAFTGKFHITVYTQDLRAIKEFEDSFAPNKRFAILSLDGVAAHVHAYNWTEVTRATCTEAGSRTGVCSCGEEKTESIPALGHTSSAYTVKKAATCTEPGIGIPSSPVCTRCGESVEEIIIPAAGHSWVESGVYTAPTCTEAGYSAGATCALCGEVRANQKIPALGHEFTGATFVKVEVTCMQDGRKTVYCNRPGCNEAKDFTMPKVDHDYSRIRTIKAATCTEGGTIKKVCRFSCGAELPQEDVPPLGHDFQELSIQKMETCTEKGRREHLCTRCNLKEWYDSDLREHVYGDYVVDKEATELSAGEKSRHCIYCKASDGKKVEIPKIQNEVEYEIIVRRTNGLYYVNADTLQFEIYKGSELLKTVNAEGNYTKVKLSKEATSLKVKNLREGYKSEEESFALNAGSPIVNVTLSASIITTNHGGTEDNPTETPPENYRVLGDVMYDFIVYNTRGDTVWLSELMKGKKLVLLDFWWTGCTICDYEMNQFILAYKKYLQPYKDQILVVMIDVMQDEDNDRIERYREQKGYPDEFIMTTGWSADGQYSFTKKWVFGIGTPGNVWLDNEGVVINMKRCEEQDRFRDFTLNYLGNLNFAEVEKESATQPSKTTFAPEVIQGESKRFSSSLYFKREE